MPSEVWYEITYHWNVITKKKNDEGHWYMNVPLNPFTDMV